MFGELAAVGIGGLGGDTSVRLKKNNTTTIARTATIAPGSAMNINHFRLKLFAIAGILYGFEHCPILHNCRANSRGYGFLTAGVSQFFMIGFVR